MFKILNKAVSLVRELAFTKSVIGKIISKFFSNTVLGRLGFRFSILTKKALSLQGGYSQRAIEYPYLLTYLKYLKPGSLILDVGCSESLLSHELIARGFRVVGLDIREYPFKSKRMTFVKRNAMNTKLPANTFDAIIVVSTIEHIGLNVYGQLALDDDGDIKAMNELRRILKPNGIIIITTPYIGNEPLKVYPQERHYNRQRLEKLVEGFQVIKEDYFYPRRVKGRIYWIKMSREEIDKQKFTDPGLACLVLKPYPTRH